MPTILPFENIQNKNDSPNVCVVCLLYMFTSEAINLVC